MVPFSYAIFVLKKKFRKISTFKSCIKDMELTFPSPVTVLNRVDSNVQERVCFILERKVKSNHSVLLKMTHD